MPNGFDINFTPTGSIKTGKTWADYSQGLSLDTRVGWEIESDLSQQLWTMPGHNHLRYQEWRLLLGAATSGLPVLVTWDNRVNLGRPMIERMTRTVVIRRMTAPSLTRPAEMPVRVHVARSGFGHDIYATNIREVAPVPAPPAEYIPIDDNDNSAIPNLT